MASPPQQPPTTSATAPTTTERLRPSFFRNAMKRKHQFIQFFAMTAILFMSSRSLGQKYRIHELQQDNNDLEDEHRSLTDRLASIKASLRREAELDSSGALAARLRIVFVDDII